MGYYTELSFNASLKTDCAKEVIDILKFMTGQHPNETVVLPANKLFSTHRWEYMLEMGSYSTDAKTHSEVWYNNVAKCYYLNVQCSFKNYDGEIEKFVKWIMPYCDKEVGDFLGYLRHENSQQPTLIFMK